MSFLWHGLTEQGAQVPVQVDDQGRVVAVDGTPAVSYWERTDGTLSPANPADAIGLNGVAKISASANLSVLTFESLNSAAKLNVFDGGFNTAGDLKRAGYQSAGLSAGAAYGAASSGAITFDDSSNFANVGDVGKASFYANPKNLTIGPEDSNIYTAFYAKAPTGSTNNKAFNFWAATAAPNFFAGEIRIGGVSTEPKISLNEDGTATFTGNITAPNITFRSTDPQFYIKKGKNKDAAPEYVGPELDLLEEIARLEALVRHLYETLRMTPPAGWPVWDGSDDVFRQLRK